MFANFRTHWVCFPAIKGTRKKKRKKEKKKKKGSGVPARQHEGFRSLHNKQYRISNGWPYTARTEKTAKLYEAHRFVKKRKGEKKRKKRSSCQVRLGLGEWGKCANRQTKERPEGQNKKKYWRRTLRRREIFHKDGISHCTSGEPDGKKKTKEKKK